MTEKYSVQQLKKMNQNMMIHPQSVPKQNADHGPSMIFSKGEGTRFTDIEGRTYIDGVSQLWNVNLGHGQSELAKAAYDQMSRFAYGSQFYSNSSEPAIRLAKKLVDYAPGDLNGVFFTSGGSEANETAFKLSRFYWQLEGYSSKNKIISLTRGYHGVTVSTQRATGIDEYRNFSGSFDPNILNAKSHLTDAEKGDRSHPDFNQSIRSIIETEGNNNVAAVILEPIQGAGGVRMPPEGYIQAIRDLCDEKNVLMISDEVICGFGRTGEKFGVNHWNVVPDMLTFAKGVTSGYFPLGGVLLSSTVRERINQLEGNLAHGFTYTGHPTGCAVALKNLEIIERENIIDHVSNMGKELQKGLNNLQEKYTCVTNARTIGLLGAFDLMKDPERGIPFDKNITAAGDMVTTCSEHGLIIRPFDDEEGMNILAIAPPLITTREGIHEILNIIEESLKVLHKKWNSLEAKHI